MTQSRLLDIAIREFGLHGMDGASTRDIARAANTAMSSITYHYGGKEGLYLAAADRIAERMAEEMAPAVAAVDTVGEHDRSGARAALHELSRRFVEKMADDATQDWTLFIMREQLTPGEAFERIWSGMMGTFLMRMSDLIVTVTGSATGSAQITTLTLLGQVMTVRASRAAMLRLCEVDALGPDTLTHFKMRVTANVDAILDRMIAEEHA